MRIPLLLLLLGPPLASCTTPAADAATDTAAARSDVVDRIVPREEALRRFREGIPEITALTGGAASEERLVRSFVSALASRDTARLRDLAMTQAEYAWLYYPTNPEGMPPYDLSPSLLWFMLEGRGRKGLTAALERVGGKRLQYVSHACPGDPSVEGDNLIRGPCTIRLTVDEKGPYHVRLFGPILRRGERFKFVNYANKLD